MVKNEIEELINKTDQHRLIQSQIESTEKQIAKVFKEITELTSKIAKLQSDRNEKKAIKKALRKEKNEKSTGSQEIVLHEEHYSIDSKINVFNMLNRDVPNLLNAFKEAKDIPDSKKINNREVCVRDTRRIIFRKVTIETQYRLVPQIKPGRTQKIRAILSWKFSWRV